MPTIAVDNATQKDFTEDEKQQLYDLGYMKLFSSSKAIYGLLDRCLLKHINKIEFLSDFINELIAKIKLEELNSIFNNPQKNICFNTILEQYLRRFLTTNSSIEENYNLILSIDQKLSPYIGENTFKNFVLHNHFDVLVTETDILKNNENTIISIFMWFVQECNGNYIEAWQKHAHEIVKLFKCSSLPLISEAVNLPEEQLSEDFPNDGNYNKGLVLYSIVLKVNDFIEEVSALLNVNEFSYSIVYEVPNKVIINFNDDFNDVDAISKMIEGRNIELTLSVRGQEISFGQQSL